MRTRLGSWKLLDHGVWPSALRADCMGASLRSLQRLETTVTKAWSISGNAVPSHSSEGLARGIHTVGEADSHTAKRPYVFFAVKAAFQYEKPEIARLKLHRRQAV